MAATITGCDSCNGRLVFEPYLTFPEIDLANGIAWCALDTSEAWKQEVRGEDRVIPGIEGVRAYPRLRTVTRMQFPMVVVGERDPNGNPYADPAAGLAANLAFLRANLETPVTVGNGTRPLRWDRPDGVSLRAWVHVVPPLEHAVGPGYTCRLMLTVSVPSPWEAA